MIRVSFAFDMPPITRLSHTIFHTVERAHIMLLIYLKWTRNHIIPQTISHSNLKPKKKMKKRQEPVDRYYLHLNPLLLD